MQELEAKMFQIDLAFFIKNLAYIETKCNLMRIVFLFPTLMSSKIINFIANIINITNTPSNTIINCSMLT